jgi:hypothetical protein
MPRRVQDILPADRRAIRDVPADMRRQVNESAPKKRAVAAKNDDEETVPLHRVHEPLRHMPVTPPTPSRQKRRMRGKWFFVTLAIVIIVAAAGYVASSYYSRATFTIVPKVIPVNVNGTYVAQSTPAAGVLSYELVTMKGSASTTVPATDGAQTSIKATGKITVYNAYSSTSIRLIAGTRFSDDTGRVYRLSSSIIIPGYTKPAATVIPGSISTNIVADQPGVEYNISRTDPISDFKVVAYKGSPKYDSVYARLASDISGGFVGIKKTVNPTTVASSTAILKENLIKTLLAQTKAAIPSGYIMYDGGYTAVFSPAAIDSGKPGNAALSLQGTLYGILFKRTDIVRSFAGSAAVSSFGNSGYEATGLDSVQVSITNLKDFSPEKRGTVIIHAKGAMKLIGTIPVDEIKAKLAGIPLANTQDVFKSYNSVIETGSGELVPPWAKIPTDLSRITVTVQQP